MKANVIKAIDSYYQSRMDQYWVELNKNIDDLDIDAAIVTLQKYSNILSQFNLMQKFKSHMMEELNRGYNEDKNNTTDSANQ